MRRRIDALDSGEEKAIFLSRLAPHSPRPLTIFEEALKLAGDARTEIAISLARARWSLDNGLAEEARKSSARAARLSEATGDATVSLRARSALARSLAALGRDREATRAYSLAMESIARSRRIYTGNRIPAAIIDEIEGTVRDFLRLTLESESPDLALAGRLIRLSGLTEIDRYFRSICSPDIPARRARDARAAIVYTASLPESFHTIIALPDGSYLHSRSPVTATEISRLTREWRSALVNRFRGRDRALGSRFYGLILQPFEKHLERAGIDRLVFINDKSLLNVSMAALHDGKNYLISRYSVLHSTGLFGESPVPTFTRPGRALLVAAYPGKGLPGTTEEIDKLKRLLGARETLEPDSVTELPRRLNSSRYRLLHIATHSTFGQGPRGAYMTLGRESITPEQFQALLRSRNSDLAHLTLSSCYSAKGDEYATLGLSGIALRSGLRSVLGSLWPAPDAETVNFMTLFYRAWQESGDPSVALRTAGLQTIAAGDGETRSRTAYWAGFILVVN